jgi:hypothetical protein
MPRRSRTLCLNFIEGGRCHIDGRPCVLGARGAEARNENRECTLHGEFDVWLLESGLLVTDLGFPPEEPVRSVALGVNESVAMCTALDLSKQIGMPLATSKRTCIQCGGPYWTSQHARAPGMTRNEYTALCPTCLDRCDQPGLGKRLGEQRTWCG